jgi:hypothetical protein
MKKTIEFSAKLNTQEFDQQISKLQNKLKSSQTDFSKNVMTSEVIQRMSKAGLQTGVPPQQAEAQQKQSLRDLDRFIKSQFQQAQALNKAIDDRSKKINELRKLEQASLDDEKKKLEVTRQINALNGQKMTLERQHAQQVGAIQQALSQRGSLSSGMPGAPQGIERLARAYAGGGLMGAGRAGYRMMGGGLGVGLGALGLLGTGISMADPLIRGISAENRNYTYAQGSAISGASGAGDVFGNRMASTMFFAPERQRALDTAMGKLKGTQFADKYTMGVGGLFGKVAAGAAGGAALGGIAGSVVPVAGNIVGAGGGAILGGLGGLGKGIYDIASDQRTRLSFMSNLGSKDAKKKLEAMQYSEFASDFNSLVEAEKNKDPVKQMAEERYQQNKDRNLQVQRSMGISNNEFYGGGGLLSRGFRGGFTEEETLGAAGSILGAGGSTTSARYNNVMANQMSKRMDMTNAGQILGGISRNLGGNVETENATIKVMSEAMKLGLDKSEFAAEQRKFAELTVSAIQASGASSVAGAAQAAASFSAFGAGTTMADLNAMGGAKAFYDSATSQTGNPRGAIFAAKIMGDKDLAGLSFDTQKVLSEMPDSKLTVDSPAVQQAAAESGMSAEEVVKKLKGIKSDSLIIRGGGEKTRQNLKQKYQDMKATGMSEQDINSELMKDPEMNKMIVGLGTEDTAFNQLSNQEQRSMAAKLVKGEIGGDFSKEIQDKLASTGGTGRIEDKSLEAVATQQQIVNDKFGEMKTAMEDAAIAASKMTEQALNMHIKLAEALTKGETLTPEMIKQFFTPEASRAGGVKK